MSELFLLSDDPAVCGVCLSTNQTVKKQIEANKARMTRRREVLKKKISALEAEMNTHLLELYKIEEQLGTEG